KGAQTITPLREVTLDVHQGEFMSLMGASGSGKTTLLNLVAGIDRPTSGRILVNGTDLTQLSRTQLAHWRAAHVGYSFQLYNLIPVLTAFENVELPLLLLPFTRGERQRRGGPCPRARAPFARPPHPPPPPVPRHATPRA